MLQVNLSILTDFINDSNHLCCEEREKPGLDIVFIANSNDSDNNFDNKSYVPGAEKNAEHQVNNTNPNAILSQILSTTIIATAANALNKATSTTALSSEIKKDTIRVYVQKRKMDVSLSTHLALSSSYVLPPIHALSSTEKCLHFIQQLLIKSLYLQKWYISLQYQNP